MDLITAPHQALPTNFLLSRNGKNYKSLPAYILDNVRSTLITPGGGDNFEVWWNTFVVPKDLAFDALIERQYQKMLIKTFDPVMESNDYASCEPSPITRRSSLDTYLFDLADQNQPCGASRAHRLARGLINSLQDEARLYLATVMDLSASGMPEAEQPLAHTVAFGTVKITDKEDTLRENNLRAAARTLL